MTTDNRPENLRENDGSQVSRLPATPDERRVAGRPTRRAVVDFFARRYEIDRTMFESHSFWEKGAGRVWVFAGKLDRAVDVESVGLPLVRVRQEHWKPTTVGARRFGAAARRNVIVLDDPAARRFVAGESHSVDWNGDWGYLFVAHELGYKTPIIGVGLYVDGELQSMLPKADRRDLI